MISDPHVPDLIRQVRQMAGLTQEKCAARLGVTFPTLNRWENGHARPSPLALMQIEKLMRELGDEGRALADELFGKQGNP